MNGRRLNGLPPFPPTHSYCVGPVHLLPAPFLPLTTSTIEHTAERAKKKKHARARGIEHLHTHTNLCNNLVHLWHTRIDILSVPWNL